VVTEHFRRHSFVVRYLTLFGGEAFSKLAVLAAFAYLARTLGPQSFGIIELALSVTVFCVLGAESGLGSYGARIVQQKPEEIARLIPRVVLLRAMLSLPAYLFIMSLSSRYGMPGIGVLAMYGVIVLLTPFFTQWVFQGLRQMQWVAAGSAIRYGIFALVVFLWVRPGSDVRLVALAEISGAVGLAVVNAILLRHVLTVRLDWRGAWSGSIRLLKDAWFLGVSDLAWAAMWYSPTLVIGWIAWASAQSVAWIAAPVRIVMALHTFVWLYFFNLLPNLSKELHEGVDGWRGLVHRSLSMSMWPAFLVALGGTLFASPILTAVYGPAYDRAVLPFQIVIWMIPVAWLSGHFRFSLIAAGHQRLEFAASAVAGMLCPFMAFAGIWFYGATGAAAALLTAGVINAALAGYAMHRVIGPIRITSAIRPFVTCLASVAVCLAVADVAGWGPAGAVACALYAAVAASHWNLTRLREAWEGRLI
jgi:O-antigen/teichoic acid export membrane protein